jgi:hypothetical protein
MKKRFLSTLRASIATLFLLFATNLLPVVAFAAQPVGVGPGGNAGGGNEDCPAGTTQIAKYNFQNGSYVAESGGTAVTIGAGSTSTSGTYTVAALNTTITYVVVKGSTDAKQVATNTSTGQSGSFDNSGLTNNGGQTPAISNIKFCGHVTPTDQCPNIEGTQESVPADKVKDNQGNCVTPPTDQCPNIEGTQETVPADKVKDQNGNCVTPPTDQCPNIEGTQESVPADKVKDNQGNCVTPPTDQCPNIEGTQETVPAGMVKDNQGNCVTDICANIEGIQTEVPEGMVQDGANCVVDQCPNIPGNQTTLPKGVVKQNDNTCKVEICHRDSNVKKPYGPGRITVSVDAIDGEGANDHDSHTGPVFNSSMTKDDVWGDIIPPVPGYNENGLNWEEGEATFDADCQTPTPPEECPDTEAVLSLLSVSNDNEEECPTDVCPNLEGTQTEQPAGTVLDEQGNCVTDVCPNIEGVQTQVPEGQFQAPNGDCFTPGRGGGETVMQIITVAAAKPVVTPAPAGGQGAGELIDTGSNALLSLFVGLTIFGLTAGVAFATPRRRYS